MKLFRMVTITLVAIYIALFAMPSEVAAQAQCWPVVKVDMFQCNPVYKDGVLDKCSHDYMNYSVWDPCNTDASQNPYCQTVYSRCTSSDTCYIENNTCKCTSSPGYCGLQSPGSTPPPGTVCGNNVCESGETNSNCCTDCGGCGGCTPSCGSPYCGQSNGCGGYCGQDDGVPAMSVPIIRRPQDLSPDGVAEYSIDPVTGQATVEFRVSNQPAIYRFQVAIESRPLDNSAPWAEIQRFHFLATPANANTKYFWNTSTPAKYRITVRAKQQTCSAMSTWSAYRRFNVVYPAPTCTIAASPTSVSTRQGQGTTLATTVTPTNGTVTNVQYVSANTAIASVSPASDASAPYQTVVTGGLTGGSTTVTATATVTGPTGLTGTCNVAVPVSNGRIVGRLCLAPSANGGAPGTGTNANGCFAASGTCTPVTPSDGERVVVVGGAFNGTTAVVQADGTFSLSLPPGNHRLRLDSNDPLNSCECPGGCEYLAATSPNMDLKFFYNPAQTRDPWWQVMGGSIYAGRTTSNAVFSPIPVDTCTAAGPAVCLPRLIRRLTAALTDSSGVVVTGGGEIDAKYQNVGTQDDNLREDTPNYKALGTRMTRYTENYDYFARLYSMVDATAAVQDWGTSTLNYLTTSPSNGKKAFYKQGDGVISSAWNVTGGRKVTVFVNGNLTINNTINVDPGSFLAFIVKGNITIGSTVCQSNYQGTDGVVEGVFVADQILTVAGRTPTGGDCKFVGEGTFVGHNGVRFLRDFNDGAAQSGYNGQAPVELIKYRPDFLLNLPDEMKRSMYQWQEVVQ